jgi:hypothetical protein
MSCHEQATGAAGHGQADPLNDMGGFAGPGARCRSWNAGFGHPLPSAELEKVSPQLEKYFSIEVE